MHVNGSRPILRRARQFDDAVSSVKSAGDNDHQETLIALLRVINAANERYLELLERCKLLEARIARLEPDDK